jgi:hypothetical protein
MVRLQRIIVVGLLALALSSCVTPSSSGSYVMPLPSQDGPPLAQGIVGFLQDRLPPATSTLLVILPGDTPGNTEPDKLSPTLIRALKTAGYALAGPHQSVVAHRIIYRVSPFDEGILLRLSVDGVSAAQFFVRNTAGTLVPASPLSVQEAP